MNWFKSTGILYVPVSAAGWAITILAAAFCLHIFVFFDARVHSVTDLAYNLFPYWVPTFLLWAFIAGRSARV